MQTHPDQQNRLEIRRVEMPHRSKLAVRFIVAPILCCLVYFVIIAMAVETSYTFWGPEYRQHDGFIYLTEGLIGIVVLSVWLFIKKKAVLPGPEFSVGQQEDWVLAVVAALAMLGISTLYFILVTKLHTRFIQQSLHDYETMMEIPVQSKAETAMGFIATCILIPILEEFIFRGCALAGMLEVGHPVISIVVSGLFFGAMHGQVIQIGYAAIAGIILGLVYYLSNNIIMPIVAHMIFNFIGSGIEMIWHLPDQASYILSIIEFASIAVFLGLAAIMWLRRKERFPEEKEEIGNINNMLPGRHT